MLDMYAIGSALAEQVATVTAAQGAAVGGTVIRGGTVEQPNSIPVTPYVVVSLPSGDIIEGGKGSERSIDHNFPVYFLYQRSGGDLPRETKTMLQWLGPLLDATHSATKLGLGDAGVKSALFESYEPVVYEYAGVEYHAWRFVCNVKTRDFDSNYSA